MLYPKTVRAYDDPLSDEQELTSHFSKWMGLAVYSMICYGRVSTKIEHASFEIHVVVVNVDNCKAKWLRLSVYRQIEMRTKKLKSLLWCYRLP